MPRHSEERRQAVMAKLLPPYNQSVEEVAEQESASAATVYKWSGNPP
jgi:transposase